jgi:hypothetical protein
MGGLADFHLPYMLKRKNNKACALNSRLSPTLCHRAASNTCARKRWVSEASDEKKNYSMKQAV